MDNNIYRVTYKNGIVKDFTALSMTMSGDKVYQLTKAYPFDNAIPSVFSAEHIEKIDCIERNNNLDFEVTNNE